MTAKEYLSQLYDIRRRKAWLQERIDELTMKAGYGTGKQYSRDYSPCVGRRCPLEDCILRKTELERQYEDELLHYDELAVEIRKVIYAVPDDKFYRTILTMRYIEFMPWSMIQQKLGYANIRRVFEKHDNALLIVKLPKGAQ